METSPGENSSDERVDNGLLPFRKARAGGARDHFLTSSPFPGYGQKRSHPNVRIMFLKTPLWKGNADTMATYPDGTLLKASGPEIDRMEAGQRRGIPDPDTFNCMGLNWGAVKTISDSEWNQIPKGAAY